MKSLIKWFAVVLQVMFKLLIDFHLLLATTNNNLSNNSNIGLMILYQWLHRHFCILEPEEIFLRAFHFKTKTLRSLFLSFQPLYAKKSHFFMITKIRVLHYCVKCNYYILTILSLSQVCSYFFYWIFSHEVKGFRFFVITQNIKVYILFFENSDLEYFFLVHKNFFF